MSTSPRDDISLNPTAYGLDDTLDVELRDKAGKVIESKRMLYRSDDTFCFSGKTKGHDSDLAFILYKLRPTAACAVFPANYTAKVAFETCDVIYPVPASMPEVDVSASGLRNCCNIAISLIEPRRALAWLPCRSPVASNIQISTDSIRPRCRGLRSRSKLLAL